MRMHPIRTLLLDESVAPVVKLRDVSSQVLDKGEFAARVLSLVTIQVEDQVV